MAELQPASVHAIVTDPPYGLGFMGKSWDHGVPGPPFWVEALRVLKPGGHLLAFGGTRTFHRLTCAIEDAGFEIRDCLMWLYGTGFPKSRNLDGEWDGWGTALKPAWEPIIMARKPLDGTVAQNVLKHGCGGINVDGCRVGMGGGHRFPEGAGDPQAPTVACFGAGLTGQSSEAVEGLGRWPANVVLDEEAAGMLDEQSGESKSGESKSGERGRGGIWAEGNGVPCGSQYGDSGGASRFFYTAKASAAERDGATHPTVKPVSLMRWLVRLVTPSGATVLDPFMGSGTTGIACHHEGCEFLGIELSPEYVEMAERRIAESTRQGQIEWDGVAYP